MWRKNRFLQSYNITFCKKRACVCSFLFNGLNEAYFASSVLIASTIRASSAVISGAKRATISPVLDTRNFSKFHRTSGGSFGVKP